MALVDQVTQPVCSVKFVVVLQHLGMFVDLHVYVL